MTAEYSYRGAKQESVLGDMVLKDPRSWSKIERAVIPTHISSQPKRVGYKTGHFSIPTRQGAGIRATAIDHTAVECKKRKAPEDVDAASILSKREYRLEQAKNDG